MPNRRTNPPWDYLQQASASSLESFELSRLNHAANLRREIAALLEQWIDDTAQALLARWLREDRKSLQPGESFDLLPQRDPPAPVTQPISVRPGQSDKRLRPSRRAHAAD